MNGNANRIEDISVGQIISVLLLSVFSALIFVSIFRLVPGFIETFSAFGDELPLPTRIVLGLYPFYAFLVFISLAPFIVVLIKKLDLKIRRKMMPLSVAVLSLAALYFLFMFWAVYLPAFNL